jgi:hypothetical protein
MARSTSTSLILIYRSAPLPNATLRGPARRVRLFGSTESVPTSFTPLDAFAFATAIKASQMDLA